ncbi:MAG: zf-HC2 domain-containing protein [Gemmatimonadetes bacterium]|nr:zf-HC2 domain-containing protein [Gemmatimonadota bacterium]
MKPFDSLRKLFGAIGGGENRHGADNGMISCDEAKTRLFEFLDGELPEISHAEVERHVEVCKACYPRFQFERHFLDALQAAEERGTASPELRDRILKVLAEEGANGSS